MQYTDIFIIHQIVASVLLIKGANIVRHTLCLKLIMCSLLTKPYPIFLTMLQSWLGSTTKANFKTTVYRLRQAHFVWDKEETNFQWIMLTGWHQYLIKRRNSMICGLLNLLLWLLIAQRVSKFCLWGWGSHTDMRVVALQDAQQPAGLSACATSWGDANFANADTKS